jgi:hypothetical protein
LVLSKRERAIALAPCGKGILGTTLRYPYEVRDAKDYFGDLPEHALQTLRPAQLLISGSIKPRRNSCLSSRSITASPRASRFRRFRHRATCAQTNSHAPSIVLNQFDDLWSPSAFRRARDRRSSCRILACHLVVHAKLHLSCAAHPR